MPTLEEVIATHRRRLLRNEAALIADLQRLYRAALDSLEAEAIATATLLRRRILEGGDPLSAAISDQRVRVLLRQLEDELDRIGALAIRRIDRDREVVKVAGAADFRDALDVFGVSVGLDAIAMQRIALALQTPSPVARLFDALPALAQQRAREALFTGIALGENPRRVATRLRKSAGIAQTRAETIARTEVLRTYRSATQARMEGSDFVDHWVWLSARDRRTCAMCWAMHGTIHPVTEAMHSHPNCRCSMGPVPEGSAVTITPGAARFAQMPAQTQLDVLGPAKYRAYRAGEIELQDLVGMSTHPEWGPIRFERPLSAILGVSGARTFYAA